MQVEAIHATMPPVIRYAEFISDLKGNPHCVVTIPEGTAAYVMGYRFVSIALSELEDYIAGGATRVYTVYTESEGSKESNEDSMRHGGAW